MTVCQCAHLAPQLSEAASPCCASLSLHTLFACTWTSMSTCIARASACQRCLLPAACCLLPDLSAPALAPATSPAIQSWLDHPGRHRVRPAERRACYSARLTAIPARPHACLQTEGGGTDTDPCFVDGVPVCQNEGICRFVGAGKSALAAGVKLGCYKWASMAVVWLAQLAVQRACLWQPAPPRRRPATCTLERAVARCSRVGSKHLSRTMPGWPQGLWCTLSAGLSGECWLPS